MPNGTFGVPVFRVGLEPFWINHSDVFLDKMMEVEELEKMKFLGMEYIMEPKKKLHLAIAAMLALIVILLVILVRPFYLDEPSTWVMIGVGFAALTAVFYYWKNEDEH